jgi:predicted metal-dependent enzyme (double-stranded beta helix superfamily)
VQVNPLENFVSKINKLVDLPESEILQQGRGALAELVSRDDWLPEEFAQPHPEYYQQYLLYADPEDRFSVVSFVWGPGQATPIHDHTVWALVGTLRGAETCQPYQLTEDGCWQPDGEPIELAPGDVEAVGPTVGDVHRVWNPLNDQVSVSVHVYGGNIGKIQRHTYREDGTSKSFVSGYSNK